MTDKPKPTGFAAFISTLFATLWPDDDQSTAPTSVGMLTDRYADDIDKLIAGWTKEFDGAPASDQMNCMIAAFIVFTGRTTFMRAVLRKSIGKQSDAMHDKIMKQGATMLAKATWNQGQDGVP